MELRSMAYSVTLIPGDGIGTEVSGAARRVLESTGVSFDWTYIPTYLNEGKKQGVPVFIAGGINPDNIEHVLDYQPDGIDVSSGIEENGRKSRKLIRQLEERMNRYGNTSR
jgi:phosphoribosylanthranilate isomerase